MKTVVLLGAIVLLAVFGGILLAGLAAKVRQKMREKKDNSLSNQLNNGHRINGGFRTRPRRG